MQSCSVLTVYKATLITHEMG